MVAQPTLAVIQDHEWQDSGSLPAVAPMGFADGFEMEIKITGKADPRFSNALGSLQDTFTHIISLEIHRDLLLQA